MEQQVTVPIETALNGIPRIQYVRSISIFGLSDVKLYFDFDSDYFHDRQEVLNRLQTLTLPQNLQPQLSPWSAIGEIYRYQLTDPKLLQYNVTLPQVMAAIAANNRNAGGNYLTVGSQSVNVRGLGLLRDIH